MIQVGLGGLGVPCSSRDPRFAGSNPAGVPVSEISGSLKNLKTEKKNRPLSKINRHIHVRVSKLGEHNTSKKCRNAFGPNDHPINTIQPMIQNNFVVITYIVFVLMRWSYCSMHCDLFRSIVLPRI